MSDSLAQALASPSFAAALADAERALNGIANGDISGYEALFTDSENVTLGNPYGPFQKGQAGIRKALTNATTKYVRSVELTTERIAEYGNGDWICLVEMEKGTVQFTGNEGLTEIALRVTTLFERQGENWKLVHRHADLQPG